MHLILSKTLGSLSGKYYFRNFVFGLMFAALFYSSVLEEMPESQVISEFIIFFAVVNTLLYPYSRFVFEKMVSFIVGENIFFLGAIFLLMAKFIAMFFCWMLAIFIAPIWVVLLILPPYKK